MMCPSTVAWGALGSVVFPLQDPWKKGAEDTEQKEMLALGWGVERGGERKERNSAGTDVLVFLLARWLC